MSSWSGNIAAVEGRPTIFDPATYYGHAEAEWGMSWCAGSLPVRPQGRLIMTSTQWQLGRSTNFQCCRVPAECVAHAAAHLAGFSGAFWSGYFEVAPKAPLFDQRRDLYTLYHILNVSPGAGRVMGGFVPCGQVHC